MSHISFGKEGERAGVDFLKKQGFRIIECNWKRKYGEIDIISKAPDGTLVFVEVKTMRFNRDGLVPEDQMTKQKRMKFKRAAQSYANQHSEQIDEEGGWRCDVLTLTKQINNFIIKHYKNI